MALYFIDTEFMNDGRSTELISIGMVSESGRELYRLNRTVDLRRANQWVKENVLGNLPGVQYVKDIDCVIHSSQYGSHEHGWRNVVEIKNEIIDFLSSDNYPEFWADWGSYDWVVFCQIFGQMVDLPSKFPMYVNDFQQLQRMCGIKKCRLKQKGKEHNALEDARFLKRKYDWVMSNYEIKIRRFHV